MVTQILMAFAIAIVFISILYFVLVKPQMERLTKHRRMIKTLKIGDKVLTAGGVVGKVTQLDSDKYIHLEISEGVEVKMRRSMVYSKAK